MSGVVGVIGSTNINGGFVMATYTREMILAAASGLITISTVAKRLGCCSLKLSLRMMVMRGVAGKGNVGGISHKSIFSYPANRIDTGC